MLNVMFVSHEICSCSFCTWDKFALSARESKLSFFAVTALCMIPSSTTATSLCRLCRYLKVTWLVKFTSFSKQFNPVTTADALRTQQDKNILNRKQCIQISNLGLCSDIVVQQAAIWRYLLTLPYSSHWSVFPVSLSYSQSLSCLFFSSVFSPSLLPLSTSVSVTSSAYHHHQCLSLLPFHSICHPSPFRSVLFLYLSVCLHLFSGLPVSPFFSRDGPH